MNDEEKKSYPVRQYIAWLLVAVVAIVLLSYFVQKRNSNIELNEYGAAHRTQIAEINQRIDALEARIDILEEKSSR